MVNAYQCYYLKFWRSKLRYRNNLNNHLIEICNFISHFRATFRRPWRMNRLGMCSDRDSITWSTEESPCASLCTERESGSINRSFEKTGQLATVLSFCSTKEWLRFKRKETGLKKNIVREKKAVPCSIAIPVLPTHNKERCLRPNASHKHPPSQMGCKGKSPYQLGNCQPISFGRNHLNINSRWLR